MECWNVSFKWQRTEVKGHLRCKNDWEKTPDNLKTHNIKTSGKTVSACQDRNVERKITPFTPLRERQMTHFARHSKLSTTAHTHTFFSEISKVTIRMQHLHRVWWDSSGVSRLQAHSLSQALLDSSKVGMGAFWTLCSPSRCFLLSG